jgi:hypothetical protein
MKALPLAALLLFVGCSAGTLPSPTPQPTPDPTPSPNPSPSPAPPTPAPSSPPSPTRGPLPSPVVTPMPSPDPSGVIVLPAQVPVEARVAIPGERVCFLIVISDELAGATWTADAFGATILPGGKTGSAVDELCVAPDPTLVETTAQVTITVDVAQGDPLTVERTITVWPETDGRANDARPYFERWIAWLATNHPELGITNDTVWQPSFVSTFLVVSHYAFWSDEWEMVIAWHNMIPPDDWTDVFLRRRGTDQLYTIGFRQDSVSAVSEPHAAQLPDVLIR